MPRRTQLLNDLDGDDRYGILLMAQVGGAPNELQLMVETARYDAQLQGLRPQANYIVRALGVREHRVTLGLFGRASWQTDHPLLYHHNTPRAAVYFHSRPAHINELIVDISQAYISTFGAWRNVAEMRDDLNTTMPLTDLLTTGYGLLGTMPKPLAERMGRVLAHHRVEHSITEEAGFQTTDEHGRSRLAQALLIDQSYVIALDFSVDELGKP